MTSFFDALTRHSFLQYALIGGLLISLACGMMGTFVVVRRISYLAGGIAHAVLGGLGAAHFLRVRCDWPWLDESYGAMAAAVLAAVIMGVVSLRARQREDTVIGALWAVGMAAGVLFLSQTPGFGRDLTSYLFGNILMIGSRDLWLVAGLDLAILLLAVWLYHPMLAVCFDEEFARLRGVKTERLYLLLLIMIALTVVMLVSVVGVIMVIALLTLPAAIAGHWTARLWQMMAVATVLCILFTASGLALSYGPNWPTGATTVLLAGAAYLAVAVGVRIVRRSSSR